MATIGLELLLPSKVRRKLLELFLTNPDDAFYIREIERRTEEDFQAVRRELERLEITGLLTSRREANLKYYQLNRNFALVPELSSIIAKTRLTGETLVTGDTNQSMNIGAEPIPA